MSEQSTESQRPFLFDPSAAWVPITKVIGICAVVAGASVWADRTDAQLKRIADDVAALSAALTDSRAHTSKPEIQHWIEVLQARNPSLNVPPFGG